MQLGKFEDFTRYFLFTSLIFLLEMRTSIMNMNGAFYDMMIVVDVAEGCSCCYLRALNKQTIYIFSYLLHLCCIICITLPILLVSISGMNLISMPLLSLIWQRSYSMLSGLWRLCIVLYSSLYTVSFRSNHLFQHVVYNLGGCVPNVFPFLF